MDDQRISIEELRAQQQRNWPEIYAACTPALLRLIRLADGLMREGAENLQHGQLLPAEFDVLAALRRQPTPHVVSPTQLCRALLISSGGLTKMLHRLAQQKLIQRPANPADGRGLLVQLSPLGKRRVEEAMASLMALHQRQIASLDEKEQQLLNDLLDKMLSAARQRANPEA